MLLRCFLFASFPTARTFTTAMVPILMGCTWASSTYLFWPVQESFRPVQENNRLIQEILVLLRKIPAHPRKLSAHPRKNSAHLNTKLSRGPSASSNCFGNWYPSIIHELKLKPKKCQENYHYQLPNIAQTRKLIFSKGPFFNYVDKIDEVGRCKFLLIQSVPPKWGQLRTQFCNF